MINILVLEDDAKLNQTVCTYLNDCGFHAKGCLNANDAYDEMYNNLYELIISDIMMPKIDGFEFAENVRRVNKHIPILFMSAKDDLSSKQKGYQLGIDDYMVKPIEMNEMLLRVNALLRRAKSVSEKKLNFGKTSLEYNSCTVTDENGSQILPLKEFQLIYKLLYYPGQIFTRQQILDDIWGIEEYVDSHTLDVHISRLREHFKNNSDFEIVTIRGLGYRAVKK